MEPDFDPSTLWGGIAIGMVLGVLLTLAVLRWCENRRVLESWEEDYEDGQ